MREGPSGARRRVLFLAYYFPPLGGAGVQRSLKFVKYLPEHGWEPIVVTTRSQAYPVRDPTLLAEVGGTRIVRAAEPGPVRRGLDLASMALDRLGSALWPDDAIAWAPDALRQVLREIRRSQPDVLLSTSAPYTSHLVALAAQRLTGIPWVADFRDEWAANPFAPQGPVRAALTHRMEKAIARRARNVVVVADYFEIAGAHSAVTIANGLDPTDAGADSTASLDPDRFRLSFVGSLYGVRDLRPVFAALRRLVARGDIRRERFELRLVGNVWLPDRTGFAGLPVVETGYLDHAAAWRETRSATALLFYVPPGDPAPSGKIYEYLASGRPILAVAPRTNLAHRLVDDWHAGRAAEPDDAAAVEGALLDLYRRWEGGTLAVEPAVRDRALARFSRRALTGELAAVLTSAADG